MWWKRINRLREAFTVVNIGKKTTSPAGGRNPMLSKNCCEVHPGQACWGGQPARPGRALTTLSARLKRALHILGHRYRHRREMRRLLELEPHRLADLGLRREDVARYARLPLWRRVPFEER